MPRPLTIERVSLNQIKRYLGNNELKRKKDYELIEAFFPKWSADPFGINAGTSQETIIKNVQFFEGKGTIQARSHIAGNLCCFDSNGA